MAGAAIGAHPSRSFFSSSPLSSDCVAGVAFGAHPKAKGGKIKKMVKFQMMVGGKGEEV